MKKILLIPALALLASGTAMAQCPTGQSQVTVSISTDAYGSETTWTLTGPAGSPSYATGGPYTDHAAAGAFAEPSVSVCVPEGSLVIFTIFDAFGDGMCCQYGSGSYSVTSGGSEVASGGSFATSEQTIFQAGSPMPVDLAMATSDLPPMAAAGNIDISGTAVNFGTTAINSFVLNYSVDNGAVQTQTITANIASGANYSYTHPTPWNATVGPHSIMVWISAVNGSADGYPSNDTLHADVSIATQTVARVATVEEFGSSTCPPCASFDVQFSPVLAGFNTNTDGSSVAAVEYHMNWPSPGNDHSYNPDGNTRRGYYGVNGIPSPWIDGHEMNGTTADINSALDVPAFMNIDLSYALNGTNIDVTAVVTPHFDAASGYKLYIAVTEDHYVDPASTTSQSDFHYSMRKMLPNGGGTSLNALVADQAQTINENYNLTEGNPQQGNYNLWGDVNGITVVAFVQKTSTKEVLQGAIAQHVVGINELQANNRLLNIWPNPTAGTVYVRYGKATSTPVHVEVYNVLGDRVMDGQRAFTTSGETQTLDLKNLDNGMYLLSVTADGVRSTQRITVNK